MPWTRTDPCPCGSRKVFGACCLRPDGKPQTTLPSLRPPPPSTGYAQSGCYMASSLDCGGGLSREHYISRALLEGLDLRIRGFPWQREEIVRVSPDNLTAKILCRRHNSALSPLDTAAQNYFLSLEEARLHAMRRSLSTRNAYYLASGDGLELWAMKTLAGLYASGMEFKTADHRFRDFEAPMEEIAQELSSLQPSSLMRLSVPLTRDGHESTLGRRAVSIGPLVGGDPPKLEGLMIRMHGLGLFFRLNPTADGHLPSGEVARPDMIDLHGPDRTSRLYLGWSEYRREGRIFEMRLGRTTRAEEKQFALEREEAIKRLQRKGGTRTDRKAPQA